MSAWRGRGSNQRALISICGAQKEGMREGFSDRQPREIRKNSIMVVLSLKLISCPNEISEANLTKRLSVYLDDMIHIFAQSNSFLRPLFSNFLSRFRVHLHCAHREQRHGHVWLFHQGKWKIICPKNHFGTVCASILKQWSDVNANQ